MIGICILNNMMLIEYCPCHVKGDKSSKKVRYSCGFYNNFVKEKIVKIWSGNHKQTISMSEVYF